MDGVPMTNLPIDSGNDLLSAFMHNKKILIILAICLLAIFTVAAIALFNQDKAKSANLNSTSKLKPTQQTNVSSTGNDALNTAQPTATLILTSPEVVAVNFYNWYVSQSSPLASKAYVARADITPEYKEIMGRYVARGLSKDRDDVFNCGTWPLPQAVDYLPAEVDPYLMQALVTLKNISNNQNLFLIKLQKTGQDWLIRDIWCAP